MIMIIDMMVRDSDLKIWKTIFHHPFFLPIGMILLWLSSTIINVAFVILHQQRTPSGNVSVLFFGLCPLWKQILTFLSSSTTHSNMQHPMNCLPSEEGQKKEAGTWGRRTSVCHCSCLFLIHALCLAGKLRQQVQLTVRQPWQISFSCWSVPADFLQSNHNKMW